MWGSGSWWWCDNWLPMIPTLGGRDIVDIEPEFDIEDTLDVICDEDVKCCRCWLSKVILRLPHSREWDFGLSYPMLYYILYLLVMVLVLVMIRNGRWVGVKQWHTTTRQRLPPIWGRETIFGYGYRSFLLLSCCVVDRLTTVNFQRRDSITKLHAVDVTRGSKWQLVQMWLPSFPLSARGCQSIHLSPVNGVEMTISLSSFQEEEDGEMWLRVMCRCRHTYRQVWWGEWCPDRG